MLTHFLLLLFSALLRLPQFWTDGNGLTHAGKKDVVYADKSIDRRYSTFDENGKRDIQIPSYRKGKKKKKSSKMKKQAKSERSIHVTAMREEFLNELRRLAELEGLAADDVVAAAQFQAIDFSADERVRGAFQSLNDFTHKHFDDIYKHACPCGKAKSPGIQLARAVGYTTGYRRYIARFPSWMPERGPFRAELSRLLDALGEELNIFFLHRTSTINKIMWQASKKAAWSHAPRAAFIKETPFMGLWLKLADVPSKPHIDEVDCIPSLNIRLQEPTSSQGPGKAFAVQPGTAFEGDCGKSGELGDGTQLNAVPREEYGGYYGTWTQKMHGCIDV